MFSSLTDLLSLLIVLVTLSIQLELVVRDKPCICNTLDLLVLDTPAQSISRLRLPHIILVSIFQDFLLRNLDNLILI